MNFIKKNIDIAVAFAVAAMVLAIAPYNTDYYLDCLNYPLLIKLFCLMAVVAGMREYGLLNWFWKTLLPKSCTPRSVGQFFIFLCFFTSMLITNDVALIIFVPLAIEVLLKTGQRENVIYVVVLQTIAANMGSMLTPMGNPQNLFIYEHYHLHLAEFLKITAPVTACCGTLLYLMTLRLGKYKVKLPDIKPAHLSKRVLLLLLSLFIMCILCVLRIVSPELLAITVVFFLNFLKGRLMLKVDFKLLGLFVLLFITVGGLSRMPVMQQWPVEILNQSVYFSTLAASQVISNVPTAVMLSGFTADYKNLLLGVSIGGLGTMIASMASLISFKAYCRVSENKAGRYFVIFTCLNILLLVILTAVKYAVDYIF